MRRTCLYVHPLIVVGHGGRRRRRSNVPACKPNESIRYLGNKHKLCISSICRGIPVPISNYRCEFFYSIAPYRRRNWAPVKAKACLPCQRLIRFTSYLAFSLILVLLTLFCRCHDGACIPWADHRSFQCAALVAARSLATNGTRILPC